jgi:hypothetical protein
MWEGGANWVTIISVLLVKLAAPPREKEEKLDFYRHCGCAGLGCSYVQGVKGRKCCLLLLLLPPSSPRLYITF